MKQQQQQKKTIFYYTRLGNLLTKIEIYVWQQIKRTEKNNNKQN